MSNLWYQIPINGYKKYTVDIMLFDPSSFVGVQTLWREFAVCLCEPYKNNPTSRKQIEAWFYHLYQRALKKENLSLSFVELTNEITCHRFKAFCLNEQMYFSQDMGVLTLPQPGSLRHRSDRDIGIWLHDFGKTDATFKKSIARAVADIDLESPEYAWEGSFNFSLNAKYGNNFLRCQYTDRVLDALSYLNNPLYNGRDDNFRVANTINPVTTELRVAKANPFGTEPHRDTFQGSIYSWMLKQDSAKEWWNRVLIHPKAIGTAYFTGEKGDILLDCPPEAVSSQLACKNPKSPILRHWGAMHKAQGSTAARPIIIMETYDAPIPAIKGPWTSWVMGRAQHL